MARVLLIGDYPPPLGGVAVHVAQLHSRLKRDGHAVRVLDIGKGRTQRPDGAAADGVEGVPDAPRLFRRLDYFARHGYVLHLHTSGNNPKAFLVAGLVAAVARTRGAKSVVTLHSGLLPDLFGTRPELRLLARVCLSGFSRVIAVSAPVREALERAGVEPARLELCPAFLPSEVRPGPLSAVAARALSGRGPLLAYAHHPSPVYGRALFFQAIARLRARIPNVTAAVFGPGTNDASFRADAVRLGVSDALVVLGEIPHAEALAVMAASSVFVRPTTADGDSVSVREALTLGIPCVASDVAPRPTGVHLFRARDAEGLARAVESALHSVREPLPQPDAGSHLTQLYESLLVSGSLDHSGAGAALGG